jgi:hypothetical protein
MKDICSCSAFCDEKSLSPLVQGEDSRSEPLARDKSAVRTPMYIARGYSRQSTSIPKCKLEPGPPGVSKLI